MRSNFTTDFYHPDVVIQLQKSGVVIVTGSPDLMRSNNVLVDTQGEVKLKGTVGWLERVASLHKIPINMVLTKSQYQSTYPEREELCVVVFK